MSVYYIQYMSVQTVLRQSNLKFRPEKTGIMLISLTLACSILKRPFRFNLTCYMSWWRWLVSNSNKFVLIRSEGRVSVGKQLVLGTASTYQLLAKAPSSSWLHWDWLLEWWGCTATTRCSVIVGLQITSFNETAGFTHCRIPGCATFITEEPNVIKQIRRGAVPSVHTGCLVLVTGKKIQFVVLHLARGRQVAHPCRIL